MELKNRLYPYPVLNYYGDDYAGTYFDIKVDYKIHTNYAYFTFSVELDNKELEELVQNENATYAVHIECPATSYRKLVKFKDKDEYSFKLPMSRIDDKLQLCTFIIAEKFIQNFKSNAFDSLYSGMDFDIDKHSILAIGKQRIIPIDKEYDNIRNVTSIFSVIPVYDDKKLTMSSDILDDTVKILLPNNHFENYKIAMSNPLNTPLIHSMLIYPVLLKMFNYLKTEDWEMIDLKWFRSLKKAMEKQGIEFTKDKISDNGNLESLAQEIIGNPILKSIDNMKDMVFSDGDVYDED